MFSSISTLITQKFLAHFRKKKHKTSLKEVKEKCLRQHLIARPCAERKPIYARYVDRKLLRHP